MKSTLVGIAAVAALAGAAHAQTIKHTWTSAIVTAGSYNPSTAGNPNAIDAGEELAFFLNASFSWSGAPANDGIGIGTFAVKAEPTGSLPGGVGAGTWGPVTGVNFGNIGSGFAAIANTNVIRLPNGGVTGIGSVTNAFVDPALLNTNNPLNNLMRFRWAPSAALLSQGGTFTMNLSTFGTGNDNTLAYIDSNGELQFAAAQVTTNGGAVTFTVVPAPASAALLGLGGLMAARRRR